MCLLMVFLICAISVNYNTLWESQKLLQKRGLVRSTFKETLSMSNSIVFLFGVGDICLKYLQSIPYRMCHQLMREIFRGDYTQSIKDNWRWILSMTESMHLERIRKANSKLNATYSIILYVIENLLLGRCL